ncbi:MAG: GAF domain-containing protein [Flammeovirgaceae bacterium]
MLNLPNRYRYTWESFQGKLRWSFVLIAGLLCIFFGLLVMRIDSSMKKNQYFYNTITPIKEQSYILINAVNKATTHINRYAINGSLEDYKDAFYEINTSARNASDSLDRLRTYLSEEDDNLKTNIENIKDSYNVLAGNFELLSSFEQADEQKGLIMGTIPRDLSFLDRYISELVDNRIRDLEKENESIVVWELELMMTNELSMVFIIALVSIIIFITVFTINYYLVNHFLYQINKIYAYASALSIGHLSQAYDKQPDEFGIVINQLNELNQELRNVKAFAQDVGEEKFDTEVEVFHNSDDLGEALGEMRKRLRDIHDKEELRTWQLNGINSLAEVIRTSTREIESFCDTFLFHLIQYSQLNQGAIYLYEKKKKVLEMKACFAFGRKKYINKEIELGHGVVGEVFRDGDTVVMTDIPQNYIRIKTGLGESPPKSLAVVPLKYQEQKLGVLELAAFHDYSDTEIELFKQISEIFTANLLNAINTNRTEDLLREATEATQKLNAQEEELRQNAEELLAMREGLERRNQLLEEELELFKALVRNDHIPTVQTDFHGNILTSSGAFLRLLKDVEGDIHNVNILDIMPSLKTLYEDTDTITSSNYLQTHKLRLKSGEFMDVRTAVNRAKVHGITRFSIGILNHVD